MKNHISSSRIIPPFIALIAAIVLCFFGCDIQGGTTLVDGEILNVKATVTVKDKNGSSSIRSADVTIKPSVYLDDSTVSLDSESGTTDISGMAIVESETIISTPDEEIIGVVPKIAITVSHDDYEEATSTAYGSGLSWDEDEEVYTSSASVIIYLTATEEEG